MLPSGVPPDSPSPGITIVCFWCEPCGPSRLALDAPLAAAAAGRASAVARAASAIVVRRVIGSSFLERTLFLHRQTAAGSLEPLVTLLDHRGVERTVAAPDETAHSPAGSREQILELGLRDEQVVEPRRPRRPVAESQPELTRHPPACAVATVVPEVIRVLRGIRVVAAPDDPAAL